MSSKGTIATIIIDGIVIFLIITVPISVLLFGFSNYGTIEESLTFYSSSNTDTQKEDLILYAEEGKITVKYIKTPVNYNIKVEINIKISGSNLMGKSYLDYYNFNWQNTSTPIILIIESSSTSDWMIKNIDIIVTIRPGIFFNINATVIEGNVDIAIPYGVTVGNIVAFATKGNISLEYTNCIIDGDITSKATTGNIALNTYNVQFMRECSWTFITSTGDINLSIYQNKDMEEDVIGILKTTSGNIIIFYRDNTNNVGARFTLTLSPLTRAAGFDESKIHGFKRDFLEDITGQLGYLLTSNDFPATNNYNLLCNITYGYYKDPDMINE